MHLLHAGIKAIFGLEINVPKTVSAIHYPDYSPETLKQVYDKACLKILE